MFSMQKFSVKQVTYFCEIVSTLSLPLELIIDSKSPGVAKFLFFLLVLCFDKIDIDCVIIGLLQNLATGRVSPSQLLTITEISFPEFQLTS